VFAALWGLWGYHYVRAEYGDALGTARWHLEHAERAADTTQKVIALDMSCSCLFYMGGFTEAAASADASLALYDPQACDRYLRAMGHDCKVRQLGLLAAARWFM